MTQSSVSLPAILLGVTIIVFLVVSISSYLLDIKSASLFMAGAAALTGIASVYIFTFMYSPYRHTANVIVLDTELSHNILLNGDDAYRVSTVGLLDAIYVKEEKINSYKGNVVPLVCDKSRSLLDPKKKTTYECSINR